MLIISKIIEGIRSINSSDINSEDETNRAVETLNMCIHQLFTMESERKIAEEIMGNAEENCINENTTQNSSEVDEVTFF